MEIRDQHRPAFNEISDHTLLVSARTLSSTDTDGAGFAMKSPAFGPMYSSQGSTASNGSTSSTHDIVRDTVRDVVNLQNAALERVRQTAERQKLDYVTKIAYDEAIRNLENERLEHEKTKLLLQKETEKLEFALGEIDILKKHLDREKKSHADLLRSVREKAIRESHRSDLLHSKCSKIEKTIEKQNDDLCLRENEISSLRQRLRTQQEVHRQALRDIEIQKAQEEYMARTLNAKERRQRRGIS